MKFGLSPLGSSSFRIGIVGGFILTIGLAVLRAIEVTPINVELAIGSLLTRSFDPLSWLIGFAMHLAICGAIGVMYAAGFEAVKKRGMGIGMGFGFVHWVMSGLMMGLVPALYSLVPELVGEPGFFGLYFGAITVVGNLIFHLLFGAVVGALYDSARSRQIASVAPPAPRVIVSAEGAVSEDPIRRVA